MDGGFHHSMMVTHTHIHLRMYTCECICIYSYRYTQCFHTHTYIKEIYFPLSAQMCNQGRWLSTRPPSSGHADLKPPAPATTCRGSPRRCCDRRRARRRPAAARKRPAQPLLGPAAAGRVAAQRVERTEPAQSGASHERPRPPRRRRPRPTVVANQRGAVHRCACFLARRWTSAEKTASLWGPDSAKIARAS